MTTRQTAGKMDYGALRRTIEGGVPDAMLGFYADDVRLLVLKGTGPQFELRGKAELSRCLRAVFGRTTHRVENEDVCHTRMTFDDVCEYPDGARVVVATMLEVCGSEILGQVDEVRHSSKVLESFGGQRCLGRVLRAPGWHHERRCASRDPTGEVVTERTKH